MQYIGIFNGNPTAGDTDGAEVSQNHVMSNPVSGLASVGGNPVVVKCAARCQTSYSVSGNLTISTATYENGSYSSGNDNIKVSLSENGPWTDSITLSNVADENVLFYVQMQPGAVIGTYGNASLKLEGTVVGG